MFQVIRAATLIATNEDGEKLKAMYNGKGGVMGMYDLPNRTPENPCGFTKDEFLSKEARSTPISSWPKFV